MPRRLQTAIDHFKPSSGSVALSTHCVAQAPGKRETKLTRDRIISGRNIRVVAEALKKLHPSLYRPKFHSKTTPATAPPPDHLRPGYMCCLLSTTALITGAMHARIGNIRFFLACRGGVRMQIDW